MADRGRENINLHAEGRPPRLHYTITGAVVSVARFQLAELGEQYRPPVKDHVQRPRPQGSPA